MAATTLLVIKIKSFYNKNSHYVHNFVNFDVLLCEEGINPR